MTEDKAPNEPLTPEELAAVGKEAAKLAVAQSQRSLDAFKPLYAQFSDEQKQVADELIGRGGRGGDLRSGRGLGFAHRARRYDRSLPTKRGDRFGEPPRSLHQEA